MAFLGQAPARLDDKGRLAIPSRYRSQFGPGAAYLTSGEEPCIAVYTEDAFTTASAEVEALPKTSIQGREGRRKFFGDGADLMPDAQGRVIIPQKLADHAELVRGEDLLILGAGSWFEIWNPTTRQNWVESLADEA